MGYIQTIESIKTIRDYKSEPVPTETLRDLVAEIQSSSALLPTSAFALQIIEDGKGFFDMMDGKVGYFGKLYEAPQYIVMFSKTGEGAYENSGFMMEKLRLRAWEKGFGTCWISLDQPPDLSAWVKEQLNVPPIALISIGYPEAGLLRNDVLKQSSRLPLSELVYKDQWERRCPIDLLESRGLSEILYYGKFAPSWGNRQPWRFIFHEEAIYLTVHIDGVNEKRALIDAGIVMLYVHLTAHDRGIPLDWEMIGDDDSLRDLFRLPEEERLVASFS